MKSKPHRRRQEDLERREEQGGVGRICGGILRCGQLFATSYSGTVQYRQQVLNLALFCTGHNWGARIAVRCACALEQQLTSAGVDQLGL